MDSTGAANIADLRAQVAAVSASPEQLHSNIFRCPTGGLTGFLGELAQLRALAGAASVIVTADAETRGAVEALQSASTRGWVAEHGWHSRREATTIATAAHILRRPELEETADSIRTTDLDLTTAVVVQAEYDRLAPELLPEPPPIVLKELVDFGARHGPEESGSCGSGSSPNTASPTSSATTRNAAAATSPCPCPRDVHRSARVPTGRRHRGIECTASRDPGPLGTTTRR